MGGLTSIPSLLSLPARHLPSLGPPLLLVCFFLMASYCSSIGFSNHKPLGFVHQQWITTPERFSKLALCRNFLIIIIINNNISRSVWIFPLAVQSSLAWGWRKDKKHKSGRVWHDPERDPTLRKRRKNQEGSSKTPNCSWHHKASPRRKGQKKTIFFWSEKKN